MTEASGRTFIDNLQGPVHASLPKVQVEDARLITGATIPRLLEHCQPSSQLHYYQIPGIE